MSDGIRERIARVRERVERAALRAGRSPGEVCVIAISKTQPASAISEAVAAGLRDIGENYVQEARAKAPLVAGPVVWHLVGALQRNKVKHALELFSWIHTLDRPELALELEKRAAAANREGVNVLIEVNLGNEPTKAGASERALAELLEVAASCSHLAVRGLMTIQPPSPDPEEARPFFRRLRELLEFWRAQRIPRLALEHLSMGMSEDFEVAIEEGATMVRIGRAIFGERRIAEASGPSATSG
jgi:pyridoxal phosphate enzyme (YggS family)